MTTVFKTTTTRGTITSTASSTSSTCDTIRGCSASDWDTTTTQTKPDHCPSPTANPVKGAASIIPPPGCPANAIVYPSNMKDVGQIPQILAKYKGKYVEIKSIELQQVAFIWVPLLDQETMDVLLESVRTEYMSELKHMRVMADFSYIARCCRRLLLRNLVC